MNALHGQDAVPNVPSDGLASQSRMWGKNGCSFGLMSDLIEDMLREFWIRGYEAVDRPYWWMPQS